MSWRTTVFLATALLIAGVVAWLDLRAAGQGAGGPWFGAADAPVPGESITRLVRFDPAEVTALHLRRGDVDVRLQRAGGRWQGVSRPQAIDDFVHNVSELAEIMPLDIEPAQRHEYGLDPPAGLIELERVGQPSITLLLGSHNPSSTGAYVQVGREGPVVLTGAIALWELDKAVRAVREDAAAAGAPATPR
jgi:hypothetical protein